MFNIDYEVVFSAVGVLSFIGWGALVFSPLRHAPLELTFLVGPLGVLLFLMIQSIKLKSIRVD